MWCGLPSLGFWKKYLKVGPGDWQAATYLFFSQFAVPVVCVAPLLAAGFPSSIIIYSFFPAFAWQHIVGHGYCTFAAVRLAAQKDRPAVTALPGLGVDLVSSLTVTLGIMLPLWQATGDPYRTWGVGLAVNLLFGMVKLIFLPFVQVLREIVPRASLLGLLGGLLLVYVGTTYGISAVQQPYVSFFALGVVLASMYGGWLKTFPVIPVVFVFGSVIGYLTGYSSVPSERIAFHFTFGQIVPLGLRYLRVAVLEHASLVVPLALGNQLLRTLSNLESAEAVGDSYNVRELLLVDGAVTTIGGAFLGSWMPTFLLAGHPGWKETGARTTYPALTSAAYIGAGFTGLLWIARGIVPDGLVAGIFIWVALVVVEVAVKETPQKHLPAVFITFIPVGAYLITTQIAGLIDQVQGRFDNLQTLALGFPFTAVVWGTIVVHLVEQEPKKAAAWCAAGAAFTFVGLMHSSALQIGADSLPIVVGYLIWGVSTLIMYYLDRWYLKGWTDDPSP